MYTPDRSRRTKLYDKLKGPEHYDEGASSSENKCPLVTDNEGRPYDPSRVVVNFNNVGTTFGKKFMRNEVRQAGRGGSFHWEGVRRCVRYLNEELKLLVIGVIFENWKGTDDMDKPRSVEGVPGDIWDMCEFIEETPRSAGFHQRSADDEMTIKCAYRRNCRMLDNDNYRDWLKVLRNEQMRAWLEHSQARIHMKYYFDSGLGCFETLDGNAVRAPGGENQNGTEGGDHVGSSKDRRSRSLGEKAGADRSGALPDRRSRSLARAATVVV